MCFNIGDRVKLVKNTLVSANKIGDTGVITIINRNKTYDKIYKVQVLGGPTESTWVIASDLIPAKPLTEDDVF